MSFIVRLFYTVLSHVLPFDPYIDVAIANSFLALFALKGFSFKRQVNLSKSIGPAFLIVVVSFAASKFSQTLSPELNKSVLDYKVILITCLWIPVVEELVYRRLFSRFLVDKNYLIWSCYLSALFFSINHSLLNPNDFPINIISLPVGPFFIGCNLSAFSIIFR